MKRRINKRHSCANDQNCRVEHSTQQRATQKKATRRLAIGDSKVGKDQGSENEAKRDSGRHVSKGVGGEARASPASRA